MRECYELSLPPVVPVIDKNRCKKTGRFLKDSIPHNKGMKGVNFGGFKTQFKKGNVPANTKHDGAISVRFHKKSQQNIQYIRIAKAKWQLLNRYTWEKYNGPIPDSHIVAFIDGNTMNCDISNLKLISRAENAIRNHNRHKASQSMKNLWRAEKRRAAYGMERNTKLRIK